MRVVVGYDGSKSAEAAIDDLVVAGLPDDAKACVVTVAESGIRPASPKEGGENDEAPSEAKILVRFAEERISKLFPRWEIKSCAGFGSPAREIVRHSDEFLADLIVVGSFGHSTLSRYILGSVSQKVLSEAHCSVRVARGRIEVDPAPVRIVIGFDGSKGSLSAVQSVADRNWKGGQVRLVAVTEPAVPASIGRFVPPVARIAEELRSSDARWLEKLAGLGLEKLRSSGLEAELAIVPGNPREVLISEAENWGADCIFVGANRFGSKLERFVLGSTSAAVAARASCSVEVVRHRDEFDDRDETDEIVNNWRSLK